ncbi:MAG: hypothetical protein FWE72_03480 [Spirochaetaceae bacterium]|nr:hypothetical protein [Spirochaetaceae bacterium]
MNIAVVIPPIEDFYFSHRRFASLGAIKGAEILRKAGFFTDIFDFTKGAQYKIELPQPIKYLNEYIIEEEKGSCSFFTSYTHFGYDTDKCASIIASGNYIAVFVSLFAFCYADSAIAFARSLKKIKPDIKIIACGAGVSVFPEYFKEYFDSVIIGEAEIFLEWYTSVRSSTQSSLEENHASCASHTSLSSSNLILPKNLLPVGDFKERHTKTGDFTPSIGIAYTDKKNLCVSLMLSRGCFKNCRFCSNFITHGRGFRNTEPEMLKETLTSMKTVFAEHKNKKIFINIEDDNILCDKAVFLKQLEIIKEFFIKIGFSDLFFSAENGLDYMLLDEDICNTLIINYNFRQFNFTMTSSNKIVTESQKRDSDLNKLENILFYLGEKVVPAIPSVTYFIAGLDSDSPEKTVDSLLFLAKTPGLSGISMFYAVPGLLGFNTNHFLKNTSPELCRGSSAFPWNNTLSTKQLITAFRISRTINFLKKKEDNLINNEQELRKKIISEKKLFTLTADNSIVEPKQVDSEMVEMFFEKYYS